MLCHSIFLLDVFFNKFILAHHHAYKISGTEEINNSLPKKKKKYWINNHLPKKKKKINNSLSKHYMK